MTGRDATIAALLREERGKNEQLLKRVEGLEKELADHKSVVHDLVEQLGGREPLKLYVWENVLHDYSSGIAFALARTEEEALGLAEGVCEGLTKEGKFDGERAAVHASPVFMYLFGGG